MLTTDPAFQVRVNGAGLFYAACHQPADAFPVECGEGVLRENARAHIPDQKAGFGIVRLPFLLNAELEAEG